MDVEMMLKQNHISFKSLQEMNLINIECNEKFILNHSVSIKKEKNLTNDNIDKIDFKRIIPKDIRNDIIYCQKSLINHLKVHQIVVTRYGDKVFEVPFLKYHLDCLENDIYEINAEQKFFLLRLNEMLKVFFDQTAVVIDHKIANTQIAKLFATYIENLNYHCAPINAKKRKKPQILLQRFGFYDSHDETTSESQMPSNQTKIKIVFNPINNINNNNINTNSNNNNIINNNNNTNIINNSNYRESVLKPKPEWYSDSKTICSDQNISNSIEINSSTEIEDQADEVTIKLESGSLSDNAITTLDKNEIKFTPKLATSISINNSRMNLLQALNKAKNQSLISSVNTSQPNPKEGQHDDFNANSFGILKNKASFESKRFKKLRNNQSQLVIIDNIAKLTDKVQSTRVIKTRSSESIKEEKKSSDPNLKNNDITPLSSNTPSSEESLDYLDLYPRFSQEIPEPIELNQEQFLRYFHLYTDEYSNFLKQRRSKRRRRIVQSNEKKEYHYGNIDPKAISQLQKEKRTFLASPPAKRKRIDNASTNNELRKKEKVLCIVCSKNGDSGLSKCEFCSKHFHTKCHTGAFSRKPVVIRSRICPPCYKLNPKRVRELTAVQNDPNKQRYTILMSQAEELSKKLKLERSRRESLLQKHESEMNSIFSLVEKIKNHSNDHINSEEKLNFHSVFLNDIEKKSSVFHESCSSSSNINGETSYSTLIDENDDSVSDGAMVIDEDYETETKSNNELEI